MLDRALKYLLALEEGIDEGEEDACMENDTETSRDALSMGFQVEEGLDQVIIGHAIRTGGRDDDE